MITVDLGKKLQGTKLGNNEDAHIHLTILLDLQEQLASLGKNLDDDEFASILLGSLPPSYKSTINTINMAANTAGTAVMPDQVIRLVTDEFDQHVIKTSKNKAGPEEAFAANGQKHDKQNVECFNCHRLGHFKSECWAKGGDKEGQHPPRRDNNNSRDNSNCNNCNQDHNNNGNNSNYWSNRNRNNNCNNNSDNANSAKADIEAWAAIEEIEDDSPSPPLSTPQTAYSMAFNHQPKIETKLYDSGAS